MGGTGDRGQVRRLRESDIAEVSRIERVSHGLPWPTVYFRKALRGGCRCWVIERGGRLLAYGVMRLRGREAHLMNITVSPGYRRQGLGARMVRHLLVDARRLGAVRAKLEARTSNCPAMRLYRALGFRTAGVARCYYPAPRGRTHACRMVRDTRPRRG